MNDDKKIETNEDVTIEPEDELEPGDQAKKLRERLKKALDERQEYLDGWQRARADLINLRKKDEEEKKEFVKYASESLIADLLPVLESFEMAKANKESWEKVDKGWREGVEYIRSQLAQALEARGLKEIDPIGLPFDPTRDEAVEYVPTDDAANDQKVVAVVQKGYSLGGKALKAPKVKVGEHKKA